MKVMCIAEGWVMYRTLEPVDGPKYGEHCTVIGEDACGWLLLEYEVGEGWDKEYFIPISEIDEMEIAKQREVYA